MVPTLSASAAGVPLPLMVNLARVARLLTMVARSW
jgi:hypothetical protein